MTRKEREAAYQREYYKIRISKDPEFKKKASTRRNEYGKENPERSMLWKAKRRAKMRGLEFNLTLDDIIIPEVCPVLGIALDRSTQNNTPSLDRIDNTKGYVKGNVKVISYRANWLKTDCTSSAELRAVARYMDLTLT